MSQRARRRHHRERMIAHARSVTRRWYNSYQPWNGLPSQPDYIKAEEAAVRYHNHLKFCSAACHGCGNHRHGGYGPSLTRQERIAELSFIEELRLLGLA